MAINIVHVSALQNQTDQTQALMMRSQKKIQTLFGMNMDVYKLLACVSDGDHLHRIQNLVYY